MTKIGYKKDNRHRDVWLVLALPPYEKRAERWIIKSHIESALRERLEQKWSGVEYVEYNDLVPRAGVRTE